MCFIRPTASKFGGVVGEVIVVLINHYLVSGCPIDGGLGRF